jgi:hypothetical protein
LEKNEIATVWSTDLDLLTADRVTEKKEKGHEKKLIPRG